MSESRHTPKNSSEEEKPWWERVALHKPLGNSAVERADVAAKIPPTVTPEQQAAIDKLRPGLGWKLHLNFDPSKWYVKAKVQQTLARLEEKRAIVTFKFGRNSDQTGKEATVYIGDRDKATQVAALMQEELDSVLLLPEGDALVDDTPFTEKIVGRFDVGGGAGGDDDFVQYGMNGVPALAEDVIAMSWGGEKPDPAQAYANADAVLRERYGAFYTGTNEQK